MIIIMMGAQGTGKGTVAGIISQNTGIEQLSTGDVFRKNIKEQTPLG
ncbi:MAG: nucleoside monophosphate kinase, partial [Clostridia bacterium]|nr:nucleoside monophosphate kinase [Clostridia bacterium]